MVPYTTATIQFYGYSLMKKDGCPNKSHCSQFTDYNQSTPNNCPKKKTPFGKICGQLMMPPPFHRQWVQRFTSPGRSGRNKRIPGTRQCETPHLYRITRTSNLIILVGMKTQLLEIFGEKHLKNRDTSRIELIAPVNTVFSI